jgi:salicylate hydroxylase
MIIDQGQGGDQGMENGLALGLTIHVVTHPSPIEGGLALYKKIRRGRAASIQVMSSFGIDEEKPKELAEYLQERPLLR